MIVPRRAGAVHCHASVLARHSGRDARELTRPTVTEERMGTMKRSRILKRVGLAIALTVLLAVSPASALRAGAAETFNAVFQETFVGFSMPASCPTGLVHLNGTGIATYLGNATEDVWGCTVPIPGTLCHSITTRLPWHCQDRLRCPYRSD